MRMYSVIALTIFAAALARVGAQTSVAEGTYTWSGELVALDEGTRVMTVKSRLVGEAIDQVKKFKAGDRVLIHWSGFDTSADAIRGVLPYDQSKTAKERFLFPAELVSPEPQNNYATLRFAVPEAAISAVKAVKPGQWVTVTSKHRPPTVAESVVSIRPYGAAATT